MPELYRTKTVICPNCGYVLEKIRIPLKSTPYGSPVFTCEKCGVTVFDREFREPGLAEFEADTEIHPGSVFAALLFTGLFGLALCLTVRDKSVSSGMFVLLILGTLSALFDYGLIRMLWNHSHPEAFRKKRIDYIEGHAGNRPKELVTSMNRLGSREYLDLLKNIGESVPEYFYMRLDDAGDVSLGGDGARVPVQNVRYNREDTE